MKVQRVMLMMPKRAPRPDARGAAHFVQPSQEGHHDLFIASNEPNLNDNEALSASSG
jgi:hypothetical protein